ncbi:MAG: hypothetical protein WB681_10340 [Candidatus Cybelea sp.]
MGWFSWALGDLRSAGLFVLGWTPTAVAGIVGVFLVAYLAVSQQKITKVEGNPFLRRAILVVAAILAFAVSVATGIEKVGNDKHVAETSKLQARENENSQSIASVRALVLDVLGVEKVILVQNQKVLQKPPPQTIVINKVVPTALPTAFPHSPASSGKMVPSSPITILGFSPASSKTLPDGNVLVFINVYFKSSIDAKIGVSGAGEIVGNSDDRAIIRKNVATIRASAKKATTNPIIEQVEGGATEWFTVFGGKFTPATFGDFENGKYRFYFAANVKVYAPLGLSGRLFCGMNQGPHEGTMLCPE